MKKVLLAVMMMGSVAMLAACGSKPCEMSWEVPEGFTSDDGMIYVSEDYPYDTSNVTYVYSENDRLGIDFDAEEYEEIIESEFLSTYGISVDINVVEFEEIESNGCDGVTYTLEYEMSGVPIEQIGYIYMSDDDLYGVTYTIAEGSDYKDAFLESAKTIKMVEKEQ